MLFEEDNGEKLFFKMLQFFISLLSNIFSIIAWNHDLGRCEMWFNFMNMTDVKGFSQYLYKKKRIFSIKNLITCT